MKINVQFKIKVIICILALFASLFASSETTIGSIDNSDSFEIEKLANFHEEIIAHELLHFEEAMYPARLIEKGVYGDVVLELLVNETGLVDSVRISKSLHPELDSLSIEAAHKLSFKPAILENQNIAVKIDFLYNFKIEHVLSRIHDEINLHGTVQTSCYCSSPCKNAQYYFGRWTNR